MLCPVGSAGLEPGGGLSSSCQPPGLHPVQTCLEPYLANGRARPQPPDPTKHVLHPLILTSTLVHVLSVQNSCGHTLLSTYKEAAVPGPFLLTCLYAHSLPCQLLEHPLPQNSKELFSRPLPAQELSDPGSQLCCCSLLSPQQGLSW